MEDTVRLIFFVFVIQALFSIGLSAQSRTVAEDCTSPTYQQASIYEYHSLIMGEEYYISFPHNKATQQSTDFFTDDEVKNVYWKDSRLFFTAKANEIDFSYPGVSLLEAIINCGQFHISPSSSMQMMGIQTMKNTPIETLIERDLLGDFCLQVSGIEGPTNTNRYGTFSNGSSSIGIENGIVLATGNISAADGPNSNNPSSADSGTDGSDPDLAALIGDPQFNVTKIEFDFIPDEDQISFDYVFASEEYCDFVNTQFNDVFGFFISGPGINGPFTNGAENIAVVPGTAAPITINNINWDANDFYYNTNAVFDTQGGCTAPEIGAPKPFADLIGFDGFTSILTAQSEVIPCETYHIKLVIADIFDNQFDSGIFLGQNSFISGNADTKVTIIDGVKDGSDAAEEGCENAYIAFTVDPPTQDVSFSFEVLSTSTATEGVDYEFFPITYTIPAGVAIDTLWIDIFGDILMEGTETIDVRIVGLCDCDDPILTLQIKDPELFEKDVTICEGDFYDSSNGPLTADGEYFSVIETPGACDSLFRIDLEVIPTVFYDTTVYRCFPEPLEFMDEVYEFAPDLDSIVLENKSKTSCDSIIILRFRWANPDLIPAVDDSISCSTPEVKLFPDGFVPNSIDFYQWVTPNLDTILTDTLTTSIPGEYQLFSYVELEDRLCTNISPRNITVEADSLIPIVSSLDDIIVYCGQESEEITGEIQNIADLPDLLINWSGPNGFSSESETITPIDTGTYIYTVENTENGCVTSQEFDLIAQEIIPEIIIQEAGLGCNAPSIQLQSSVEVEGGIFTWTGPNGFSSNDQNPLISEIGTYTLEYSLSANCTNIASVDVETDDTLPEIETIGDTIICQQGTGIVSFTSTDVASFSWTGPSGFTSLEMNPEVVLEGVYTVQVVGTNGCINQQDVTLEHIDIVPFLDVEDSIANCYNPVITLNVDVIDNNLTYDWSGPGGFSSNEKNPQVSMSGTYIVEVLNEEGCTEQRSLEVIVDTIAPTLVIEDGIVNCDIEEFTISPTIGGEIISFEWSGPNGFASNEEEITVNQAGSYILNIIGNNGCVNSNTANVEVDTIAPTYSIINDTLDCNTGEADIAIQLNSSSTEFEWFDPNENSISTDQTEITVTTDGIYSIILTDPVNFCQTTATLTVSPNELTPDISLEGDIVTCENTTFNLTSISSFPNLLYDWTGPSGFSSTDGNPNITEPGIYSLEILSDEGCRNQSTIEVIGDLASPDISLQGGELNCFNYDLILELTDTNTNNEYSWTSSNGFTSNVQSPLIDEEGIYTVVVTGNNFCDTTVSVEILADQSLPSIEETISNDLDCYTPESTINITTDLPDGASYEWDGPEDYFSDESSVTVDLGGDYVVTVTAENGCTSVKEIEIEADFETIDITLEDGIVNCYQPSINLLAQLSSMDYVELEWDGPAGFTSTELSPETFAEGEYTLKVTASNGCISEESLLVVNANNLPLISLNSGELSCTIETIEIGNSLDSGNYSYQWFDNNENELTSTTSNIKVEEPGTYQVIVTDLTSGCTEEQSTIVSQLPDIESFNYEKDDPDCFNPKGRIEFTDVTGGSQPFQYSINGGADFQTNPVFDDLIPGTFDLIVIDGQACQEEEKTEVISLQDFELQGDGPFLIFLGDDQQLNVETSLDPADIASITWSPEEDLSCTDCLNPTTSTFTNKIYQIEVVDNNGCIYVTDIEIRVLENPYYVPNVFSPNDDGKNEFFTIFGPLELITNVNVFSIYDRWGELVHHTEDVLATDESMKWYGNFKDQSAQVGVYAYYIEFVSVSGLVVKLTGDVTIIR